MVENENSIVFDLILLEADRIIAHRQKNLDLYYKDINGAMVKLTEAYDETADEIVNQMLKRKKMRYMISFVETIDMQDSLKPSSHKLLRFFCKEMNYGNTLRNYGLRDIRNATGINMTYLIGAIKQLCQMDIVRFTIEKGRRLYIVNPMYFYKGSMKKIFYTIKEYNRRPKYNEELEEEYIHEEY
jgi:hypothetical protein